MVEDVDNGWSWWEQYGVRPLERENVVRTFSGTIFRFTSRADQEHNKFLTLFLTYQVKTLNIHHFQTRNSVMTGGKIVTFLGGRAFILGKPRG